MAKKKRIVSVFIGSRANYGSAKSIMRAVVSHPDLCLQVVVGASALLDRYGEVVKLIETDGFVVDARVSFVIEGSTPLTMAKTTALGLNELATVYHNLKPDVVFVVGDRHEVLAATIAAAYMNIPVAHSMGGEVSGTIDESVRHAITKLAHIHFPATKEAANRIIQMGENPRDVFCVGCPRIDEVSQAFKLHDKQEIIFEGVGDVLDLSKVFLLVSQHPVTTEYEDSERQIKETMTALSKLKLPTIMLWPNNDAGSDLISGGIRKFREQNAIDFPIHFFKNLSMDKYFYLMRKAGCMIGNSSSIIREGSFIGVPGVVVGSRQKNREHSQNIIQVNYNHFSITQAVKKQLAHGPYPQDIIYGDGQAGRRIAKVLAKTLPPVQKTFHGI